jgi:hypothetical protein
MSYISGELSDEVQVVELTRGTFVPFLLEGVRERFMVRKMTCYHRGRWMCWKGDVDRNWRVGVGNRSDWF